MATIEITDKWRIASDINRWTLQQRDEFGWKTTTDWSYVTLRGAVSGLRDILLRESKATDIKQLERDAKDISKLLERLTQVEGKASCHEWFEKMPQAIGKNPKMFEAAFEDE